MPTEDDIGSIDLFGEPLRPEFLSRGPLVVAPELLGCVLASTVGGVTVAGRIVETEAYLGSDDAGSHAATKGITRRNAVMYGPPGHLYVYFTYGNHFMLNLVCSPAGTAGAVLIRALEPTTGAPEMSLRRGRSRLTDLCSGPGKLSQALGVDLSDNGAPLGSGRLQVYAGLRSPRGEIATSTRVGLTQGHDLPYRFYLDGNEFVSKGRPGPSPTHKKRATGRGGSST
jgi:DNA-3-methyladenine glycosylase